MHVEENVSLKPFNTFGINVNARFMTSISSSQELSEVLSNKIFKAMPKLVLGGGSNILFTKDFDGIIIRNNLPGITIVEAGDSAVTVRAGAGVTWHDLVTWAIDRGLGGIENLSLIPGKTGAAPIQNIGAYGVELKETFQSLEAVEIESGDIKHFNKVDCEFGYRDSIFKRSHKGRFVITAVMLQLQKHPVLQLTYGAIEQELKNMGVGKPDVKTVSEAVCNIRRSKLPDPAVIGNAGSFFKNPEISADALKLIQKDFPGIVFYPLANGNVKLAAGWLIEQCGWKGKVVGQTGSHKNQALVLVNYGNASGNEIWNLAMSIRESVMTKFGVNIEPEVNII